MKNTILIITMLVAPFAFAEGDCEKCNGKGACAIEKFDTDGDGQLSEAERDAARNAKQAKIEEHKAFRASFDLDQDGELSADEEVAFKEARAQKVIEHFDADGDGVLNDSEKAQAEQAKRRLKKLHKKGERRRADLDGI